jgi:hypothetical protein
VAEPEIVRVGPKKPKVKPSKRINPTASPQLGLH